MFKNEYPPTESRFCMEVDIIRGVCYNALRDFFNIRNTEILLYGARLAPKYLRH